MSRFFVGQRIKKVRGQASIGTTGVVFDFSPKPKSAAGGMDFRVVIENPTVSLDGRHVPAGARCAAKASQWEPILPEGHKPCEEQFKRDLDRLLEREGATC